MASIIKKIKSEFDKGLVSVSVNSSTLLEITKLNGIIASLREQREVVIHELGKIAYEEMLNDNELVQESKLKIFNEIVEIDNKINEKLDSIQKLNDEKNEVMSIISKDRVSDHQNQQTLEQAIDCKNNCGCGAKIKEEAKFCTSCGKPVQYKNITEDLKNEEDIFCKCGAQRKAGVKFCSTCGVKFEL